jgi:hypothetical protein
MTMNFNNLEFHELAYLFPLLEDEELQKIADDIKHNGFRPEPITLLGGKILDGRNRYNAANLAAYKLGPDDVEHFEERYPGQDPLLFVIARNLYRRHLTAGQRACLAAELYKRMAKRPVGQPKEISGIPDNTPTAKESLKKAAKVAGVSVDSVQQVLHIEKVAPAVAAEVKAGKKSLHEASQAVKREAWRRNNPDVSLLFAQYLLLLVKYPGSQANMDQMLTALCDEKLLRQAENLKKQFLALARASEDLAEKVQLKHTPVLTGVFNDNFRRYAVPMVKRAADRFLDPLHYDLANDLYIALREVERCLDRYPDQLSEAASRLLILIRQYNPELAWTYCNPFSPGENTPEKRTGEPVRF